MLKISWQKVLLVLILLLATFLYTYRLSHTMVFTGDVGWFYLDARDLLLGNTFPLVGITSSHPWLHQGAYWTYLLAAALSLGGFKPSSGAYLAVILGLVTIVVMYIVGSKMFSSRVGVLAAFLFVLSPLATMHMRTPYHTTILPLLSLLFIFYLHLWVKGRSYAFVLLSSICALLYNFELASIMFIFPLSVILVYGYMKRTGYMNLVLNKKILRYSFFSIFIIMLPMLTYDTQHGFPQTLRFGLWLIYRLLVTVGIIRLSATTPQETWGNFFQYILTNSSYLFYFIPVFLSFLLCILIFLGIYLLTIRKNTVEYIILTLCLFSTVFIFLIYKTPSDAYVTLFFPYLILAFSVLLDSISKKHIRLLLILLVIMIGAKSEYLFIRSGYSFDAKHTISYRQREEAVSLIIQKTAKSTYTIEGKNMFIQTPSFTMNYEYLLWYLGHPVGEAFPEKIITIEEAPDRINIGEK